MFPFFFQSQIFLLFISLSFAIESHIFITRMFTYKKNIYIYIYPRTYEKTGSVNVLQEFVHFCKLGIYFVDFVEKFLK